MRPKERIPNTIRSVNLTLKTAIAPCRRAGRLVAHSPVARRDINFGDKMLPFWIIGWSPNSPRNAHDHPHRRLHGQTPASCSCPVRPTLTSSTAHVSGHRGCTTHPALHTRHCGKNRALFLVHHKGRPGRKSLSHTSDRHIPTTALENLLSPAPNVVAPNVSMTITGAASLNSSATRVRLFPNGVCQKCFLLCCPDSKPYRAIPWIVGQARGMCYE